jgi:hypothetical protein
MILWHLIDLNMGTICRSKNICSVFSFLPYMRKQVWRDVSIAGQILSFRGRRSLYFFGVKNVLDLSPGKKKKNPEQLNLGLRNCRSSGWFALRHTLSYKHCPLQKLPVPLNCSNQRWMLFTCGSFLLNPFLNLRCTNIKGFFRETQHTLRSFSVRKCY